MHAVLKYEKQCMPRASVGFMSVPGWPELAVSKIWPLAVQLPGFLAHMPHEWHATHHKVERDFFYGILATSNPDFLRQLIMDCQDQRAVAAMGRVKKQKFLDIKPEVLEALLRENFVSGKSLSSAFLTHICYSFPCYQQVHLQPQEAGGTS